MGSPLNLVPLSGEEHDSLVNRIRELEALLVEAQGILIDSMLDEGYSVWMEQVDKALEARDD